MEILAELYGLGLRIYSNIVLFQREDDKIFYIKNYIKFIEKYNSIIKKKDDLQLKTHLIYNLIYYYNVTIRDFKKSYKLLKEAEALIPQNDVLTLFEFAPISSYVKWKAGHPEEAIEVFNRWYPLMIAYGYKKSQVEYLWQNALIAKEMLLKEEEREFIRSSHRGPIDTMKEDMEELFRRYPDVYEVILERFDREKLSRDGNSG